MSECCTGLICGGAEYITPRGNKCQHFPRLCTACCMHKNSNLERGESQCTFEHTKLTKRKAADAAAKSTSLSTVPPSSASHQPPAPHQSAAFADANASPAVEPDNKKARTESLPQAAHGASAGSTSPTDIKNFMRDFTSLFSTLSREVSEQLQEFRRERCQQSEEGTANQPLTLPRTPTQNSLSVSTSASPSTAPPVPLLHAFRGQTLVNGPLAQQRTERLITPSSYETVNTINTIATDASSIPPFSLTYQSQHASPAPESQLFDPVFTTPPSQASAHHVDTLQHVFKEATRERRAPWKSQADLTRLFAEQEKAYAKRPGATAERLGAMHQYSVYIGKIAENHGLDVATNYHFALMARITEGNHSLVKDGPQCHALWTEHIEYRPRLSSSHSGSYSHDRSDRAHSSSGTNKKKRKGSSPSSSSQRSRSSSESATSDSSTDAPCSIHKGAKHTNSECRSSSKRQ